jgi:cobalt-zinc-cadmium efflux system protein
MSRERRLGIVFFINALLLIALVAVGFWAHSLGVLAAAGDYLTDALAIGASIFTIRLARRAPTADRSFGYERTTILAALLNASLIVAVAAAVVFEAIQRLVNGAPPVQGLPVAVVNAVAAGAMFGCAIILGSDDDLNVRSVWLSTASDAVAAAGVAITGLVIWASGGLYWLDPAIALVIAMVIGYRALGLLREVADVLLESTPKGLRSAAVASVIRDGGEISDVHDLHIWSLSSDIPLLSAHVVLVGHPTLEEAQEVIERAKARLLSQFGISHATLETECEPCATPDLHRAVGG